MTEKEKLPYYSICIKCAKKKGGTWPKRHCATFWNGKCPYCEEYSGLCSVGDWEWSDGKGTGIWD